MLVIKKLFLYCSSNMKMLNYDTRFVFVQQVFSILSGWATTWGITTIPMICISLVYDSHMFSARCLFSHSVCKYIFKILWNICSRDSTKNCVGICESKEKTSVLRDDIYIVKKPGSFGDSNFFISTSSREWEISLGLVLPHQNLLFISSESIF